MHWLRVLLNPVSGWGKMLLWSLLAIAGTFVLVAIVGQISSLAGCTPSEVGRCEFQIGSLDAGGPLAVLAILGFASLFFLVPVASAVAAISALACIIKKKW